MSRIGDRLRARERRRGSEVTVIVLEGGLPDANTDDPAIAGWRPLPSQGDDEPFAALVAAAMAAGQRFVVIGGLPGPGEGCVP